MGRLPEDATLDTPTSAVNAKASNQRGEATAQLPTPESQPAERDSREAQTVSPPGSRGRSRPKRARRDTRRLDFSRTRLVGRFELLRELAHGGMGQVFLARDPVLGRKVAIKFLLRDDPQFVERFLVEARATARCTHENIVTIFEVGEHEGLPYMVLEFLEGKTLSDVLATKPTTRQLVELFVPVAHALARAHEHGIVHRDLKPSNIFVTTRGVVKVLDFGVARFFDDDAESSDAAGETESTADAIPHGRPASGASGAPDLTAGYVGTLPYMSPEQWGAAPVDGLSDLWPFGIMLWRGLTGAHPVGSFDADVLRTTLTDLSTPLPSIGERAPTLPPGLVAIVDRCLAKRKADRFPDAGALARALEEFLSPSAVQADSSPYRGLAPFGEEDAGRFFGRSSEVRAVLAQLEESPVVAVVGPSGAGKSSFVHAGIVPALRASGSWHVHTLRPGREPLLRLASILGFGPNTGASAMVTRLLKEPGTFGALLREKIAGRDERILVAIDQLEELFTLCDEQEQREAFLGALLAAADDASTPVRVVASMRADFIDRFAAHKTFLAELSRGLCFLAAPDQENMREVLVRPAEQLGYRFEGNLVEEMLAAATGRGALPLVSFAAARLWEARDRERKLLTSVAYQEMGGVAGAFGRHADQVVAGIPASRQPLLRAIMQRLVTTEGTRAIRDRDELLSLAPDRVDGEAVLDQLVRGRLIVVQTDPDRGATVEIVHEMLLEQWPTLRRWLDESQATRAFLRDLHDAAKQWESHGREPDRVWRGTTARDALAQVRANVLDLSTLEREFLDAAAREIARDRRRRIAVMSSISTALVLVFVGGAYALVRIDAARKDALREEARAHTEAQTAGATTQFMVDLFKVADPSESLGNKVTVREILDKGASRITSELAAQPAIQATLMDTIGVAYTGLGLYPPAVTLLDQAVTLRKRLLGPRDPLTIASLEHRGWVLSLVGRYDDAVTDLRDVVQTLRAGTDRDALGRGLSELAEPLYKLGKHEEAFRLDTEALAIREALHGENHVDVAESLEDVGVVLSELGRPKEGLLYLQRAVALRRRLQGPAHPLLAEALSNLAVLYSTLDMREESLAVVEEAVAMERTLRGNEHPDLAIAISNLGFEYEVRGRLDDAERSYREALVIANKTVPDGTAVPDLQDNLAYVLVRKNQLGPAIELLRDSLARREKLFGPEHNDVARSLAALADIVLRQGNIAEANALVERALVVRRKVRGNDHPDVGNTLTLKAVIRLAGKEFEEAHRLAVEGRTIMAKTLPPDHWKLAIATSVEGGALLGLKRYAEAEPLLIASAPQLQNSPIPGVYERNRRFLFELYTALHKPEKAREYAPPTPVQ